MTLIGKVGNIYDQILENKAIFFQNKNSCLDTEMECSPGKYNGEIGFRIDAIRFLGE